MADRRSRIIQPGLEPANGAQADLDAYLLLMAGRIARFAGWSVEVPSGEVYWSAELFTMLGFESAGGAPPVDVGIAMYPEQYRELVRTSIERCMTEGVPMEFEAAIVDRSGQEMRVRVIGEAVRNDGGTIVRVDGAFYDISQIVVERENRIAAQQELRTTLDYIPDAVCFVDENWRFTFVNESTVDMTGMSADELASDTLWELFPDVATTSLRAVYERAMFERVSGTTRAYLVSIGKWVEVTAHPTPAGIAIFATDVTDDERQRSEISKITARAYEQAALLDASNEAMIIEDLGNVVLFWNKGAELIYGWTREEAIGRNIRDLIYSDRAVFEGPAAALLRDGRWSGELEQRTKDGRTVIIECRWQAVLDDDGTPEKLFAVNSDITAQRRERDRQSRAQRMESLGTLAGGIAHDLNNVLTPLLMSVQLMREQHPDPMNAVMLEGMEVGIKRGADMIRQVLTFARGAEVVHEVVNIAEVIHELGAVSLQALPSSITVVTQIDDEVAIVGDKTQVLQILMNLVTNAGDAMSHGGSLVVTVSRQSIADAVGQISLLTPGDYACISVEDAGAGMPADVLDKVFEPFFTTKDHGKGTGLGLASSMAIARSHGGTITAYSEVGTGSRFILYLPLAGARFTPEPSGPDHGHIPAGAGELVLVVDDEASIRRMVRLTLEAHGYRTAEASNGREAIEVFAQHADDVRLVLTDMMMPVMDGAATAAYFSEHHPDVAVVAASGLNANGGVARASHSGVRHFVAKPFTTETLLRTLHEALRGPL